MTELFRREGMVMLPRPGWQRPPDEPDAPEHLRGPEDDQEASTMPASRLTAACQRCGRAILPSSTRCADCRLVEEGEKRQKPRKVSLRTGTCVTCGQSSDRKAKRCARCAFIERHRTSKTAAAAAARDPVESTLTPVCVECPDCGCLLAHPDELCPACTIPWLRKAARDAAYATFQRHPTTTHVLGGRDETSDDRRDPEPAADEGSDPRELRGADRLRGVA